ncbi:hypothetical protein WKR88_02460 [Trinickia caryophylli]|uniref:Uncharacterized protein n=1 Tax=Trinickia caryophylli TaxID=28094 RepID=A0A1X7DVC7_TRICW|nr:hypothetical protein [Trinickia caryophylli]PMS14266.1 hypothetical protein C0Z17_01720 [Trinickia caryophylli]TRX17964.1 hypothetical protein FNF07_06835 [Trinickia caryophylli]WQE11258.1 hypothetical protein U0034_16080 [Trinickia caryophylli]SMF22523.1 hypothetical protein SAMN06295900_10495 [Trinickia caryophylli]GLU32406.1 hypothetical protein Busp01_22480 [Trinickia caryophylli]
MTNDANEPHESQQVLANITVTSISPPDGSKLLVNVVNNWSAKFSNSEGEKWTLTQPAGAIDADVSVDPSTGNVNSQEDTGPVTIKKKGVAKAEQFVIEDDNGASALGFTYTFVTRVINPLSYSGEVYAVAPFNGQIDTNNADQLVGLQVSADEDGAIATNVELSVQADGNAFLYDANKAEIRDGKLNTGATGTAVIYVANTVPGIFKVNFRGGTDQYGNPQVEGSQSIQVVIADSDGGGNLTPSPYIVEMGGGTLDLDSVGSTVTVKIDTYPPSVGAFMPVVIVVNNVPVVNSTLNTFAEFVTAGIPIPATLLTKNNNFIYYATYISGANVPDYESVPLGPFETTGAPHNEPLTGVSRTYPAPALAPNINIVNQSAIAGGLPVYIDNSGGMIKTGDKIYVMGYANGWDGDDATQSRGTSPRGYPYPLTVTDQNKNNLTVNLDQAQLSNFGDNVNGRSGNLKIDYYVLAGGVGPKLYSKYKADGWDLRTAFRQAG